MRAHTAFSRALEDGDYSRLRQLWGIVMAHLPQPESEADAEIIMHTARTASATMPLAKRLYSHAWLEERGLVSSLPAELHPPRTRPVVVPAVGVAVNSTSADPDRRAQAKALEAAMTDAAGALLRVGITDARRIATAMWDARTRFLKQRMI